MIRTRARRAVSADGSVSVVMVVVVAVTAVLVVAVSLGGALGVAAARAQGAADAGALAGAARARDLRAQGEPLSMRAAEACADVRDVVDRWGLEAPECVVDARGDVFVEVSGTLAGITVTRSSRAGAVGQSGRKGRRPGR